MSVQTIVGGIIGAVAGFVVGGPMGAVVGAGLGAGLGAMATPIKVQGAKVGEEELASVASGTPIGIILGEGGIKGDLLWQGPRVVVKVEEEQEGKGGGTTVENEEVQRDYAIHFCESNARRGTKIRSVKIIRRNKIIVYDTRPESKLTGADNAKFMANVTFYFGDADQGVDPTYEAHFGHLGAPAYRNQFTMVVRQHLLGKFGNAIPTYEVVTCGGPYEDDGGGEETANFLLVAGQSVNPGGPVVAGANASAFLSFSGIPQSTGATIAGAIPAFDPYSGAYMLFSKSSAEALVSTDNRASFQDLPVDRACNGYVAAGHDGILINGAGPASGFDQVGLIEDFGDGSAPYIFGSENPPGTTLSAYGTANEVYMCRYEGGFYWMDSGARGELIKTSDLSQAIHQAIYKRTGFSHIFLNIAVLDEVVYAATADGVVLASYDGGATYPSTVIAVGAGAGMPLYMKVHNDVLVIVSRDSSTAWTSADDFALGRATGVAGDVGGSPPIFAWSDRGTMLDAIGGKFYIVSSTNFSIPEIGDSGVWTADGLSFSDPASTGLLGVTGIAAGTTNITVYPTVTEDDVELPDAADHYVDKYHGTYSGRGSSYVVPAEHDCSMSLASMIQVLSKRTPVPPAILDTSRVEDIMVRGVSFRATGPVRNAVDTLAELYQFDVVDSGGGITIVPRGGPIDVVVEDGDILLSSKDVTKKKRGQQSEFPKIATLRYVDPTQGFEESSQRSVIKSKDFRATGEKTFTVSVTMMPDEAATQIARIHAEMQDQLEGGIQFDLPLKYLAVIPSCVISYLGKRYRVTKRRVEPWKIIVDSAVYDRASTYSLTAQGTVTGHTPTPQSDLVGPTMFAPMNMPVAIDAYDRPCLHAVVQGISPGWRGADIYIKRGTGPYELTVSNMSPGVMGELTDSIEALAAYGIDYTQTLKFKLYANGEAESITLEQLLEEQNPFALVKPDYTTSIGQFMDVTEVDPQMYEATGLLWGRLDTTPGAFAAGSKIVFLDRVQMIPLRASDLGQTIKVKAVSRGSAVEAAPEHIITLATMESMREWAPYNVTVTADGTGGYCVAWIGRARLGSSYTPINSQWFLDYEVKFTANGKSYLATTMEQALCVGYAALASELGAVFGWPEVQVRARSKIVTGDDDFDSEPSPPPVTSAPGSITPFGSPASTTLGVNGGYPDNAPYPVPQPTTFGTNIVVGGNFDYPSDIANWRDEAGNPLDARWSLVGNRLCFFGTGIAAAFFWPARRTLALQLLPHYSFEAAGTIESDAGAKGSIGVGRGYSTQSGMMALTDADTFSERHMKEPAEYGVPTAVTHAYADKREGYGVTGAGQVVVSIVTPAVLAVVEGAAAHVYFDNITMEIAENVPVTAPQSITNLDFSAGLTGWVQFPAASALSPSPVVVGGAAIFTPVNEAGTHKYLINEDPITDLNVVDKWLELIGKTWSDDPTVFAGMTQSGVGLQYAISTDGGATYNYSGWSNTVDRGDWTTRKRWIRQTFMAAGVTFHVGVLFKARVGYSAGVKDLAANVTTGAIAPPLPGVVDEPFSVVGSLPGGYVGSAYTIRGADGVFGATGGYYTAHARGDVVLGVAASGSVPLSDNFAIYGTPRTAESTTGDLEINASGTGPSTGSASVSDALTILAKPAYSLPDWRYMPVSGDMADNWTTFVMDGGGPAGMPSIGAVDTGEVRCEFIVSGATYNLYIGINVQHGEAEEGMSFSVNDYSAYCAGFAVGNGTWAVELNATTGAWKVLNSGGTMVASGTLALPVGKLYRFAWSSEFIQSATVKMNMGNAAWAITPTGSHGPMPFGTVNVPVAWRTTNPVGPIDLRGNAFRGMYIAEAATGSIDSSVSFGDTGKSAGQWRVQINTQVRSDVCRVGLAVATFDRADGHLGASGTENSIGCRGPVAEDRNTRIEWCFGGVHSSVAIASPGGVFGQPESFVLFLDMTTNICRVFRVESGALAILHVIPSVPAGTWFPAMTANSGGGYAELIYDPIGPSGAANWTDPK